MGIKRFLLFILVFQLNTSLFSQESNDTVYLNNHYYIKHIVGYNQTIDEISEKYNVSVKRILQTNETSIKLFYNQTLYIPIKRDDSDNNIFKNTDHFDIALLLPFYKNLNDTLVSSFENKEDANNIILGKSKMALEFMQGIQLALDSLEKTGVSINLVVYDTRNDSSKVLEILQSRLLDSVDIIIGPIYSKNMKLISDRYGNDKKHTLISPLSKSSEFLKNNFSTIQLNTPYKNQVKIITEFIEEKYNDQNITICYEEPEKGLALYMQKNLSKSQNKISMMNMIYTHIDSIRTQFLDTQIIILPSNNRAFVSKMLGTLGGIDSSFIVFGLSNIKNYDHLDLENLMHLDVHFPDPYYFNSNNSKDKVLLNNFEEKFMAIPSRFSVVAYNIMMNFCTKNQSYEFEKFRLNGGKVNINAPLVKYQDYSLEKVLE
jgi:DNA-binding transcriptional regulator/RsmH inhibitor MraZ